MTTKPETYASEEETKALLVQDTRTAAEQKLAAMMTELGADEQGAEAYPILRQIAVELLDEGRVEACCGNYAACLKACTPRGKWLAEQPAQSQQEHVLFKQFLSDVMTAAGLVKHGKQCKALGERLSERVVQYLTSSAFPQPAQPQQEQPIDGATLAGLHASASILSTLVDQQRQLLVEIEDVFGRDGHGGPFEDGEFPLIDRVRAQIAAIAPPEQPAQPQQEPDNLKRLAAQCPELNMANYNSDDVDELNSWAIEVATAIDALAKQPAQQQPSSDTLYLLRRLLSNQNTLTGPEFREELTKIVADAYEAQPQPAQPQQSCYCINCEKLSKELAALKSKPQDACCAECGKKDSEGWALYCVECIDKLNALLGSIEKKVDTLVAKTTPTPSPKNHGDI